jgi:Domain of unknown function (DUF4864)
MRTVLLAGAMAMGLMTGAVAQDAPPDAVRSVIQGQIDAFIARDPVTAFTFASPMIKGMFGTPENFGMMVSSGYPMIWSPSSVKYLGLRDVAGRQIQRVMVTDGAGATFLFDYDMIEVPPDGWKINGVFPVPDQGAGA